MTDTTLNHVLIVEDEEDIVEILRIALEFNSSYQVSFAKTGPEDYKKQSSYNPT